MKNLSDFANFGEFQFFLISQILVNFNFFLWGRGTPNGSLRPGCQKPSLRLCYHCTQFMVNCSRLLIPQLRIQAGLRQLPDLHIARMEQVKQLAAFAAALFQLLLLLLLPCPHCLCHSISAVVSCFCCYCPSSAPLLSYARSILYAKHLYPNPYSIIL